MEKTSETIDTSKKKKVLKPRVPNFLHWLKAYEKRYGPVDPIADLAMDARCDKYFPKTKSYQTVYDHMTKRHSACDKAVAALKKAYTLYAREYGIEFELESNDIF